MNQHSRKDLSNFDQQVINHINDTSSDYLVFHDKNIAYNSKGTAFYSEKGPMFVMSDNSNNLLLNIHGDENGLTYLFGKKYNLEELYDILKSENIIPSNTKNIYTLSCYGGLQNNVSVDGIEIKSSHSSNKKVSSLFTSDGKSEVAFVLNNGKFTEDFLNNVDTSNLHVLYDINQIDESSIKRYNKKFVENNNPLSISEAKQLYSESSEAYFLSQGIDLDTLDEQTLVNIKNNKEKTINKLNKKLELANNANDINSVKLIEQQLQEFQNNNGRNYQIETEIIKKRKEFNYLYKNNTKTVEKITEEVAEQVVENTTEEVAEQVVENTTEETVKEVIKETERQTEHNFKETLEQTAKEMVEENTKVASKAATKSLPKKSLSGGGKFAIGIAIAGLVVGGAISASDNDSKKKSKKTKAHSLPKSTNSEEIDNSYAMQMAQDISSYRYGKHMTGFVNY